ncbi:MAG: class I SAM-dependent methyltransferase [Chromatiales bacterium]|nr:class I SAM-dependent methyltransferase [Chromatiales bacterium]
MNDLDKALDTQADAPAQASDSTAARAAGRLARRALFQRLRRLHAGRLTVREGETTTTFGDGGERPELAPSVRVTDPTAWLDIVTGGTIGAAEAYMQGKWTVSDLPALIRLFAVNRGVMEGLEGGLARLGAPLLRLAHWYHSNTRRGSRRNIRAHYDLGDELFRLFLDPLMMYSSAVFPRDEAGLEEAALHKLALIGERLHLSPDDHVLEIGTGWGGLALYLASEYGCRVTTTTISANQFDLASRRVAEAGLGERVTVVRRDYRDLDGQYDRLVSVEMIEAVGHRFLDSYFRICSERLKPTGRALIQGIIIADRHYEQARRSVDFIQKYIFPGGALPSLASLLGAAARATDLQLTGLHDIGHDYARTLALWRERFLARVRDVRLLGYPDEFIRMWEWYLAYCEGGFRERTISTVQLVFDKPDCRLPALRP